MNRIIPIRSAPRHTGRLYNISVRFDLDVLPFSELRQVEAEVKVEGFEV